MRRVEFYKSLSLMNNKDYIEKFLLYNASLVISGVKPSETITLKKTGDNIYEKWINYGDDFFKQIGIEFINLRETSNALIILAYNKEMIKSKIFEHNNKEFLMSLGYSKDENLEEYLYTLINRYEIYNCPHELGVFLGIPIDDVKDFMECSDKKCLYCGYWKVYNECNKAREIFEKYDKIKEHAVHHILNGDSSYNLAINIKKYI